MRVTSPVSGFTGEVAGVAFADGVGETTDARALAYFARHGYGIDLGASPAKAAKPANEVAPQATDPERDSADSSAGEASAPRSRRRS